jgi:hypothetical protein
MNFREADETLQISAVHICTLTNETNEGYGNSRLPTTHWISFLELSTSDSVKADLVPGDGEDQCSGNIFGDNLDF